MCVSFIFFGDSHLTRLWLILGTVQQPLQQQQPQRRVVNSQNSNGSPQIPASQQPVPQEPRKYTGGAIPSRSFQMLQAMVSPDVCGMFKKK